MTRGNKLSPATIAEIKRLWLDTDLMLAGIARIVGVSCGSVRRYTIGQAPSDVPAPKRNRKGGPQVVPKYRCPGCGVMTTQSPCACATQRRRPIAPDDEDIQLCLEEPEATRLQEVRDGTWTPTADTDKPEDDAAQIDRIDPSDPKRLARLDVTWKKYPDRYPA